MDISQIKQYLKSLNLPDFRMRQIVKNYFSGRYTSFAQMSDLPLDLRTDLDLKYPLLSVVESNLLVSDDSQKVALKLHDGLHIESVLMDYGEWLTACISTQVGCPLACTFCATGKMGLKRNLAVDEIVDQIIYWNTKLYPKYVGRLVFMGMGEPFLNWDNLLLALKIINDKDGLNIGSRKISISTAGVAPKIIEFANLDTEINLALSLHSADQSVRNELMPISRQYSLTDLKLALDYYTHKTNRQVMLEYILIDQQNDRPQDVKLIKEFIGNNFLLHVNIIPLNPVQGGLIPSTNQEVFTDSLDRASIPFTVRRSIGRSINSACGQLITQI
ncbi:MAG: 23S rRNA (adenine(2503)-C(2))-methyltransferase RlmN [Candidatus Shapirobacteria bacterium]